MLSVIIISLFLYRRLNGRSLSFMNQVYHFAVEIHYQWIASNENINIDHITFYSYFFLITLYLNILTLNLFLQLIRIKKLIIYRKFWKEYEITCRPIHSNHNRLFFSSWYLTLYWPVFVVFSCFFLSVIKWHFNDFSSMLYVRI